MEWKERPRSKEALPDCKESQEENTDDEHTEEQCGCEAICLIFYEGPREEEEREARADEHNADDCDSSVTEIIEKQ